MKSKKLRIAVVGLGEQMCDNLFVPISISQYTKIVAICDVSQKALDAFEHKFGVFQQYTSYEVMIATENIDVIVISSYPDIHYAVAKHAMQNGIHVFIEKPPTRNLEQLNDLVGIAAAQGIKTGVGMNFSYTDSHEILKNVICNADFGALSFVLIEHISSKPKEPLWNLDSTIESFLLAQLIHPLDYILSIGGKYKTLDVHFSKNDYPLVLQIMIEFENGIIGCLKSGSYYPRFRHQVEMISDQGNTVRIDDLANIEITTGNNAIAPFDLKAKQCVTVYTPSPLKSGYSKAGYETELNIFFEHVLHDTPYEHALTDMIKVYEAMEDIQKGMDYKSSRLKTEVEHSTLL
ncbi:Gfo/Idh/MocA family protein [Flavobacterium kingsejongi]|uniref:Gfo/Idh/MocA-like oxidoreductase N-terminal domain-containing protein n=1 Tax=Flavobacterium kingsejongi TaxID=1678728 RepID=A0A2S1LK63_9FLAO|nr:Gfo/Idh/MocA family oxidoreductase [Flavobacterium kingsejongi]AWG24160.1 hypothetical protein FK004_02445 [Flavobacterium kingsejongi]